MTTLYIIALAVLAAGCAHRRGTAEYWHDECLEAFESADEQRWKNPTGTEGADPHFCFNAVVEYRRQYGDLK